MLTGLEWSKAEWNGVQAGRVRDGGDADTTRTLDAGSLGSEIMHVCILILRLQVYVISILSRLT